MLSNYTHKALQKATFEGLPEGDRFYAEIPGFVGVYATGATLEDCRAELTEVLEEWIVLRLTRQLPLPIVDGIELRIRKGA